MTKIKYPEQKEMVKKMRTLAGVSTVQAAELVHIDLRNWQRWESGEYLIPESAVELFCIKKTLNYAEFARPKSEAQILRDQKRKDKFDNFKAKQIGSAQAHGLPDDEDGAFEPVPGNEEVRKKIRGNLEKEKIVNKK